MATEFFDLEHEILANESIPVSKYKSKTSPLTAYFVDVDSEVINGYFCFGVDEPEACGVETLLWQLDSSGGLLPRPLRGDMLKAAWQFHGAENPLADRDQSSFVCCSLGEAAFTGTFSCSVILLQNLEAVFEIHGIESPFCMKPRDELEQTEEKEESEKTDENLNEAGDIINKNTEEDVEEVVPSLDRQECYCLSEAGEGAMAWEGTIQSLYPNSRAFWNRLLFDGKSHLGSKMRTCYDKLYRPENLNVIITGRIKAKEQILESLHDYENYYKEAHPWAPKFVSPWSDLSVLAPAESASIRDVRYVARNSNREPLGTVCVGWRGCSASDIETSAALKVLTAHIAVGPLWDKLVISGTAHRISWCQLEYPETCSLLTIHGVPSDEAAEKVLNVVSQTLKDLISGDSTKGLSFERIRSMADRVGWHYIREIESDTFMIIASSISKAQRYGKGIKEQIDMRLNPRKIFDSLKSKPLDYWIGLLTKYFNEKDTHGTRVLPKSYTDWSECFKSLAPQEEKIKASETSGEMSYAATSRRASSRPRMKSNPVGQEVAIEDENRMEGIPSNRTEKKENYIREERLEEELKLSPFPFGDHEEEVAGFESRLEITKEFLDAMSSSEILHYSIASYKTDGETQHPLFNLTDMPFYTLLEDVTSSFAYITFVIDTTQLVDEHRKILSSVIAAIGGMLCPRPPGLDTDVDIKNPNEFNPPKDIIDSQVSIGLNGEMMQSLFLTLIVTQDKYEWAVGMLKFVLYEADFTESYLKFVTSEAARGLSANYRVQTAETPKYESFDSGEINLHGLIKKIYAQESNARLFVGRRRLDLLMEYIGELKKDPAGTVAKTNETWKALVNSDRILLQIATDVTKLTSRNGNLSESWKTVFHGIQKPLEFEKARPSLEQAVMKKPGTQGILIPIKDGRPPCLSLAIPIDPNSKDFPKLCVASQLISMAQKWVWCIFDEPDNNQPIVRMPCSYANLITLNLESMDLIGALAVMKRIIDADWAWLGSLLIATKLMVVNDPVATDQGPQGSIVSALLTQLSGQEMTVRRDLLLESMNVTVEDIKYVITEYFSKLFDPACSWASLIVDDRDKVSIVNSLEKMGFSFENQGLMDLCTSI